MIRALIIDDEPHARDGLRLRLARETDVEIIGEAGDGLSAVRSILELRPDLIFLDVQMPGMDGFSVLEGVAHQHLPKVIFVTAFDAYAVRAFAVHAVDYLLKPVVEDRLREAVVRARRDLALGPEDGPDQLATLLDAAESKDQSASSTPLRRLAVRDGNRYIIVKLADVEWIGSAGNYAELHFGSNRTYLARFTLVELERRLDPERFVRIHRSTIVNTEQIVEIVPDWHGDSEVTLKSGHVLRMSRTFRGRLLEG